MRKPEEKKAREKTMLIREWKREDLPRVHELLVELSATLGRKHRLGLEHLHCQFEALARRPETYRSFVCEADGEIAGFLSLVFYASALHPKGTALVNELVVSAGSRGKGVGRALMAHAVKFAQEDGWDEIEVGAEKFNTKAIDFYKACGLDKEYILLGKEFGE
jgi:GNAT superfamily N-acetyltransferase